MEEVVRQGGVKGTQLLPNGLVGSWCKHKSNATQAIDRDHCLCVVERYFAATVESALYCNAHKGHDLQSCRRADAKPRLKQKLAAVEL